MKSILKNRFYRKIVLVITFFIIIVPLGLILVFLTKPASSSGATYVRQWGSAGAGHGNFQDPYTVAIDSSDNVYVVDTSNNRIQKFDNTGTYITQWGSEGTGNGQFNGPEGIAIDSSDNVYVVDTSNNRVEKFTSSGTYITQWGLQGAGDGQFQSPVGVAVDKNSNVFIVDGNNDRVEKFDSSGNYIGQWGSIGTGNGQFDTPSDIAIDPWGSVYVLDQGNSRVEKFDNLGNYLTQWGSSGAGHGTFNSPEGIGIDSSGNVYVADSGNDLVQRFDSVGNYVLEWGSTGAGNSQFSGPSDVAVDSSGNVFVVDTGNNRVQEFTVSYDLGPYTSIANPDTDQGTNNVYALLENGNTLYVGGADGLYAVDTTTGSKIIWDPGIPNDPNTGQQPIIYALAFSSDTNTLYAAASDGILAFDVSSIPGTIINWMPDIEKNSTSSAVLALAIQGTTLYAGGDFDSADGQPRLDLTSYDISTSGGVLTNWTADTNSGSEVLAMKTVGTQVYVGGNFSSIGGTNQAILADIDTTNSSTISASFAPSFDQTNSPYVKSLESNGTKIYAGGSFDNVNGTTFTDLVSLDQTDGTPDTSWIPTPANPVYALAVNNNYLYVGESDQILNGTSVSGGAAINYNLQTGNLSDWSPEDDEAVNAMIAENNALYVGLIQNASSGSRVNNIDFTLNNLFKPPVANADIGGFSGTVFLAEFDPFTTTPTPTPLATSTPTPTVTPTAGPTSAPSSNGGSVSAPVCSDTKPTAPSNLTVTAGTDNTQVVLTWTAASAPVTDYSITYSDDQTVQKWGVVSTGNVTTYTITQLDPNTTYYFWVNAVNGCMPGDLVGPATLGGGPVSTTSTNPATAAAASGTTSSSVPGSSALGSAKPSLAATGPVDLVKAGGIGIVLIIVGAVFLLAL